VPENKLPEQGTPERDEIELIRAEFLANGYKLSVSKRDEGWRAPFMRATQTSGVAAYGFGESALDAARDARVKLNEILTK
jgi:hypothetical protein